MKFHYVAPNGNDFEIELAPDELVAVLTQVLPLLRSLQGDQEDRVQRLMELLAKAPLAQVS